MKPLLLLINTTAQGTSTARIACQIAHTAHKNGWRATIAYGRGNHDTTQPVEFLKLGSLTSTLCHVARTRLGGMHGRGSTSATRRLIAYIDQEKPAAIHLHNIHGYFLDIPLLFNYLRTYPGRVVWTLHDCWPLTGHCPYYSEVGCNHWATKQGCHDCPQIRRYPQNWLIDNSHKAFMAKKQWFANMPNLTLVAVSSWMANQIRQSYLADYPLQVIPNGVDTSIFQPQGAKPEKKTILAVASIWKDNKNLDRVLQLAHLLPDNIAIEVIGRIPFKSRVALKMKKDSRIGFVGQVNSDAEMSKHYRRASLYVNTSTEETYGMTTLEAMACGTHAITYNTTGCAQPYTLTDGSTAPFTKAVESGPVRQLALAIIDTLNNQPANTSALVAWVQQNREASSLFARYLSLYK